MKLYIGVTKDNELYYINWDKCENQQRKTFTLTGGCYDNPKTEAEGEEEARETLSDSEYWEELYNIDELPNILTSKINYKEVAEEVLSSDGWENTNGEYNHFGEDGNEEVYLNSASGGQHTEERNNFIKLWIGENDFKTIMSLWEKEHLKPLQEKTFKKMEEIFSHYEKKGLFSDEEVLIKYLDVIKWRQ